MKQDSQPSTQFTSARPQTAVPSAPSAGSKSLDGMHIHRPGPSRKWTWLTMLVVLVMLFAAATTFADGLQALLTRLRVVQSSTPPSVASFGAHPDNKSVVLSSPPSRVESSPHGLVPRQMTPEEARAFFPFPLHYPAYVPRGLRFAYVTPLPLTTRRALIVLQEEASSSPPSSRAHIEIVEYPSQLDDGNSPYMIPQGAGQVVQVAGTDALYVDAVWSGDPPQRDERFHQLVFQRDGLKFFLYAPRDRVPLSELLQMAASLRAGPP